MDGSMDGGKDSDTMTRLARQYEPQRKMDIRWIGKPPRQRVGLALSGGAARGVAHIGVLEVLEEHGIEIDCIAGTSAGALVGGLYAAGVSPEELKTFFRKLSWFDVTSISLPKLGLLNFDRVTSWVEKCLEGCPTTFEELPMRFAAVAADIISGDLVAITEGKLSDAIRASSSVPGILTPTHMNGNLLVDGGIINNLPVSVAHRLGADYVVAVDLLPPGIIGGKEPHNMFELMVIAFYMLMQSTHNDGARADRIILPKISDIGLIDIDRVDELLEAGRQAAIEAIPQIKSDLEL